MATGTSYFPYAHNFAIGNLSVNPGPSKTLFEHLSPYIVHGAAHDSNERCNAPTCHRETRVAIREDILGWIKHGDGDDEPKKIMWLSGPAGAGKTAIAGSVSEACKAESLLAAGFFFSLFSPSVERRLKSGLIATPAHHISQNDALDPFRAHLLLAMERYPDISQKNLKEQAERLILGPLRAIHDHGDRAGWPKVIIIDGLDEVVAVQYPESSEEEIARSPEADQIEILSVLFALSQSPFFPFRIFIASRPEHYIGRFFATKNRASATINLFLDSKYEPDADSARFLKSKFSDIRRRFGIANAAWPGQNTVDHIVDISSGQFIVPSTAIRWIDSGVPQQRLEEVMQLQRDRGASENPFATVDALYHHILKRARNPNADPRLAAKWLLCIHDAYGGWLTAPPPATFWRQFLEDTEGELNYRLEPIVSLISVPSPHDTPESAPITFHHKSLIDFLSVEARRGDLYVNQREYDGFVADKIVGILKNKGPPSLLCQCQQAKA